jgi:uncharacterized protein YggL (DUF469 family)
MAERGTYRNPPGQSYLSIVEPNDSQFVLMPVDMPDPASIDPRQWIYGRHLIRGFVTLLVAPGGTGKSSLVLGMCIAIATGRELFGTTIYQSCNTALLNLEDPEDEIKRRLAAIGLRYGISGQDIAGKFFMNPADQKVLIAAESEDGFDVVHPHERKIIERVRDEKIGVLSVDPFAESHTLEENSNPQMVQASAAWRRVARLGNCAVLLAHHVRKGLVESIEAARGAKALTDSARVGLILSNMTEHEADALAVEREKRLSYVRLDDAKANLAPRATKASWFHLNNVKLNNGTPDYPNGDNVVVIESWEPPQVVWEQFSAEQLNHVLDEIDDGLPNGVRYYHTKQSPERWAGLVLIRQLGITDAQAGEMIRTWLKNDVLQKKRYHDVSQGKEKTGLVVVSENRPGTA